MDLISEISRLRKFFFAEADYFDDQYVTGALSQIEEEVAE